MYKYTSIHPHEISRDFFRYYRLICIIIFGMCSDTLIYRILLLDDSIMFFGWITAVAVFILTQDDWQKSYAILGAAL